MRPQDVLVTIKIALGAEHSYPDLAAALGMSISEVHGAVKRATAAGLVDGQRRAKRAALLDFIMGGLRQAFVPKRGPMTRGMPTAHGAPPLDRELGIGAEPLPVWPDPDGAVRGESFSPLYRSVPAAAKRDPRLYEALCLVDAIRGGRPRDRQMAEQRLRELLLLRGENVQPLKPASFSLSDPRRQKIFHALARRISPGTASFYASALELLAREPPLAATSHLVGHLASEIESSTRKSVLAVMPMISETVRRCASCGAETEGHKSSIKAVLKWLDIPIDGPTGTQWLAMAGKDNDEGFAARRHRRHLDSPRMLDPEFWARFEGILYEVLEAFEGRYLAVLGRFDDLAALPSPTEKDARAVRETLPQTAVALQHFFSKLTSPAWIEPLNEVGFFSREQEPVQRAENVAFSYWPALGYLARMAPQVPKVVARIAWAVPMTTNARVNRALCEVALALPPEDAAPFAARVDGWLDAHAGLPEGIGITDLIVEWSQKLAGHPGCESAAIQVIGALLRPLPATTGSGAGALHHEPRSRLDEWELRLTMERLTQSLVTLGRPALKMLADTLADTLPLMDRSTADPWDDDSQIWRPMVEDHPANRDDDLANLLVAATRDTAVGIVKSEPDQLIEIASEFEGRRWLIFRRLALYLVTRFPSDVVAIGGLRDRLRREVGEELTPASPSWLLSRDPLPAYHDEFVRMTSTELVARVGRIAASVDRWPQDQYHLSREIAAAIEQKPEGFASTSEAFKDLAPEYVWSVFEGFHGAVRAGRFFDWSPVLALSQWAMLRGGGRQSHGKKRLKNPGEWGSARLAVLRLLSEGLTKNSVPLPPEGREQLWTAIFRGLDEPAKDSTGDPYRNPMDQAVAQVRSTAVGALIDFALWISKTTGVRGLTEEAGGALERSLADFSVGVRAMLGFRIADLIALAPSWVEKHGRSIFAADRRGRDVAWEVYLKHRRLRPDVFKALRWRYNIALDRLASAGGRGDETAELVGADLGHLYWHGHLEATDEDAFFNRYLAVAAPAVTGNLIQRIGRWLHVESPPSSEAVRRLQALWESRARVGRKDELAAFTWWFSSGRFDDVWALHHFKAALEAGCKPVLCPGLSEQLIDLVPRHASAVLDALVLMVKADDWNWFALMLKPAARAAITEAFNSKNSESERQAKDLISRLCARGYADEFGSLMPGGRAARA